MRFRDRCPRSPAPVAAPPGSTRAGPSSSPRPLTAHSPGGASRSSATGQGDGRPPSPIRRPAPRQPPRPHDQWHVRRRSESAGASCAPQPFARRRRLGEPHRDRKVGGRGAMPLAPTRRHLIASDSTIRPRPVVGERTSSHRTHRILCASSGANELSPRVGKGIAFLPPEGQTPMARRPSHVPNAADAARVLRGAPTWQPGIGVPGSSWRSWRPH
jgi:hypothetical protein